jgi:outer membrane protein assembly factor BamB
METEGQRDLIVLGSKKLVAYDPASGKERWSASGFPAEAVAVAAVGRDLVFAGGAGIGGRSELQFESLRWENVAELDKNSDGALEKTEIPEGYRGVQRPELPEGHPGRRLPWPLRSMLDGMDENKDGKVTENEWTSSLAEFERRDRPVLMALRTGKATFSDDERIAWSDQRGIPEIPSPLFYEGKLFLVRDGGLLRCLDAASGSLVYDERVGVSGGYVASPVAANGRVYLSSQSGTIVVVDARSDELKILARNVLGESITATPAMVGDLLYVRTAQHLYAFSANAHDRQGEVMQQ